MWWENLIFVLVGSLAGIIPILLERIINHTGKINLFAKFYYFSNLCAGIQGGIFCAPIKVEIINTKNSDFIMRDLNLYAYNKGKEVAVFDYADESRDSKTEEVEKYGNDGNYSWLIQKKNILTIKCLFTLSKEKVNKDYDEIVLSYKDIKNKEYRFSVTKIEKSWYNQEDKVPKEWVQLKIKRNK